MRAINTRKQKLNFPGRLWPVAFVAAILLSAATTGFARAGNAGNPGVLPPQSHPYGKSYSEWAAAWWQWAFSFPAGEDTNPVQDPTGALAELGDQGPVWFLAGSFGVDTVRTCRVPSGKALFFPLYNWSWVTFPTDPPMTIEEIRDLLRPLTDTGVVSCEIDGKPVQSLAAYREESVVFDVTVPEGNLLGLEPGVYGPCLDDGYYLMLAPLTPGEHLLHLEAHAHDADLGVDFDMSITYHLTVH